MIGCVVCVETTALVATWVVVVVVYIRRKIKSLGCKKKSCGCDCHPKEEKEVGK